MFDIPLLPYNFLSFLSFLFAFIFSSSSSSSRYRKSICDYFPFFKTVLIGLMLNQVNRGENKLILRTNFCATFQYKTKCGQKN